MKDFYLRLALFGFLMLSLTGCYQASSNGDDDLRAYPVTNNPTIVPEDRGFGSPSAIPY